MTSAEIPSKTVVVAATYRGAMNLIAAEGLTANQCMVATSRDRLHGLILREHDRILLGRVLPEGVWRTLQHLLAVAKLEITDTGVLVRSR